MSAYNVRGKFAIVTGAGSGINLAFTEQLLVRGCSVLLADIKLRPEAEEVVAKYTTAGEGKPTALFHKIDLTDWDQISSMWSTALAVFPQVDIVCNGAGILDPPEACFWHPPGVSPLARDPVDAKPGQYRTFAVNTAAPIRIAQIAIDYWLQNRHIQGNLLWVASVGGYVHNFQSPLYFASKAAVVSFVRCLALMREKLGIRNAAICPGPVHDDLAMTPQQCASVMIQILTEPQYGDGNVVEVMMVGSKQDPKISVRDVPLEILYPSSGVVGQDNHVVEEEAKFVKRLQQHGLRS
ncbi:hypothetical protein SLS53_004269 [Cytospora paraplurivora]|uniref:15-hydroxyprostaglandin dehydrogenase n=1 Tax=Cytospora paraplurivora TaxID=2898453 RepID=A0AAN9U7V6_9PEZI